MKKINNRQKKFVHVKKQYSKGKLEFLRKAGNKKQQRKKK